MAVSKKNGTKKKSKTAIKPAKWGVILEAAKRVFGRKGFPEATISEIAKEARVSESTIYGYFSNKEDLLFSIPAETAQKHFEKNLEILPSIQGAANKLRMLIYRHLQLYMHDEDYAKVIMLILKGNRNFLKTDAYKVVQKSAGLWTQVIKEGIQNGEFRANLNGCTPHITLQTRENDG